jgi:Leucine-rich repeat (LRR) protein
MKDSRWVIIISVLLLISFNVAGQKSRSSKKKPVSKSIVQKKPAVTKTKPTVTKTKPIPEQPKASLGPEETKVKDIVSFLEYLLNNIGSAGTAARDKDVLITESYTKIFRDPKVQIEDDLDEKRNVVTYKDVSAYLKDVDFFYSDVKFEFVIENINNGSMADGKIFYKVAISRNLKGTTADGKVINNTIPRFIEINYDPKEQDLKIVSIYTNEFNEKESLESWWNDLSYEWKGVFKNQLSLEDSVNLDDIRKITSIESLDLSNNKYIQTILPLTQLLNLTTVDLSNTAISDLSPLRNLSELTSLNISNTKVRDLSPLKYAGNLQALNINGTLIHDISAISKMIKLQQFEAAQTNIDDFGALRDVTSLDYLNLASTTISDLTTLERLVELRELNIAKTVVKSVVGLGSLKKMRVLNIDSTQIKDFGPLSSIDSLTILYANNTAIENLNPLQGLTKLEKIFCDQTHVTKLAAADFQKANPRVLIINDSKDLSVWWNTLQSSWQKEFIKHTGIAEIPTKENLAKLITIDSINIEGNSSINSLEPLRKLQNIKVIHANETGIRDLTPIKDLKSLTYLDISETEVNELSPLSQLTKLAVLKANKTKIENLDPLYESRSLTHLYLDHTYIHDIIAHDFLERNSNCLITFKTIHLNRWWKNLNSDWRIALQKQMGNDTTSTTENLHRLIELQKLQIQDIPVKDLSTLSEFIRLKELHLSGTAITDISFLTNIPALTSLHITNSPLQKLDAIKNLLNIQDLDISNTGTDDLKTIEGLKSIKSLNCSGTQIKKLNAIKQFINLEYLDFSNTNVNSLDAINDLPIKTLKCYNTKVSNREIESFKKIHPNCNVIFYR